MEITKEGEENKNMKNSEKQESGQLIRKEGKSKKYSILNSNFQLLNSNSGITLIALVVTIVILLILAGITINLVLADGGIFNEAEEAKEKQRVAEILEMLNTAEATVSLDKNNLGKPTLETYKEQIYTIEKIVDEVTEIKTIDGNRTYEVITEDGYVFQITEILGKNVNDIKIEYEGPADNLPVRIYKTGAEIDVTTGKGKVSVELKRAENATSYTYLYKLKDDADYTEAGKGTGTTYTYEGLTLGETYLFRAKVIIDGADEETEPIEVTVNQPVTSITIEENSGVLINNTIQLEAKVEPEDASNKTLEWTSSDTSVATVNSQGTVTGKKQGVTIITAKATDGSNVSSECSFVVYIETNKTETDANKNSYVVPTGFAVVPNGMSHVEYNYLGNSQPTVQDGIVIQDVEGNQFVWVPVGEIKNDVVENTSNITNIKLGRYSTFTMDTTTTPPTPPEPKQLAENWATNNSSTLIGSYYQEYASNTSYNNTKATDLEGWINTTIANKGYYIARYEASYGTNGKPLSQPSTGTPAKDGKYTALTTINFATEFNEGQLWNYINQSDAATAAKAMYPKSEDETIVDNYYSDLVNSYAWDTAIIFIQTYSEGNSAYASQKSKYTNSSGQPANTGERTSTTTDKVCNIYDIASNEREWVTETYTDSSSSCVSRGGLFSNTTRFYASIRNKYETSSSYYSISFRSSLYVSSTVD